MKNTYILALLYFWLFANASFVLVDVSAAEFDIDELIIETDLLKISDSAQFRKNLIFLKTQKHLVNSQQDDFIKYLSAYENVLDGDFDEAQLKLKKIFQSTQSLEIKIRTKATLANVQAISMEYNKALTNIDFVIENIDGLNDVVLINKIKLISSIVYFQLEIYEMSFKYAENLVSVDPGSVMKCKGSVYLERSKMALGIKPDEIQISETINYCKKEGELIYASALELAWIQLSLDKAVNEKNKISILEQLNKVKLIESKIEGFGYNNMIGLKDMLMAKAYYHNGEFELAVEKANLSISGSAQSGITEQVLEGMKVLQQVAINSKDFEQAFKVGQQIREAENTLSTQAKSKQMAYMAVKHDTLTKQIEIQELKQNNQLLSLENKLSDEKARKQQLFILLIILTLFLLGVWTYRIKKKHDYFKDVADIDHLTKVFTRKAFEEKMNAMLNKCHDKNKPLNLGIMDLDHFKSVNDRFGHLVGDWVLRQVILKCEQVTDEDILIARLGGEEFCIVSPYISQSAMVRLMEKMRKAIERMDCLDSGAEFDITASFGVSSTRLAGYQLSTLLSYADLALFEAKNGGRNKVVVYENKSATTYLKSMIF